MYEQEFLQRLGFSACRGALVDGIYRHYVSHSVGGITITIGTCDEVYGWVARACGRESVEYCIADALKSLVLSLERDGIVGRDLAILRHFDDLHNPHEDHAGYEHWYKRETWI